MSKFTNDALNWAKENSTATLIVDGVREFTFEGQDYKYTGVVFSENEIIYKGKKAVFKADILGTKLLPLLCYMQGLAPEIKCVSFNFNDMTLEEELKTTFPVVPVVSLEPDGYNYFKQLINQHLFTNCRVECTQMSAEIILRNKIDKDDKIDPVKDLYRLVRYNLYEEIGPVGEDAFTISISYQKTGLLIKMGKLRKLSFLKLKDIEVDIFTFWKLIELAAEKPCMIECRRDNEEKLLTKIVKTRSWKKLLPKFLL